MFKLRICGITEASYYPFTKKIGLVDPSTPVESTENYHVERFHDISKNYGGKYIMPSKEMLIRVLEFSKSFMDVDRVIIHCHAGISRSSSVAIAVLLQHGLTIEKAYEVANEIRPLMAPNSFITKLTDEIFDFNGKLVEYHKNWMEEKDKEMFDFAGQGKIIIPDEVGFMKNILGKL